MLYNNSKGNFFFDSYKICITVLSLLAKKEKKTLGSGVVKSHMAILCLANTAYGICV